MKRLLLLCLICCWVPGLAQKQELSFHSLTPQNGLSQISVNTIWQDERGAIWIGTRDGLNRYTGSDVKVYRLEKANPESIFCNNIYAVCGDGAGTLYLLCSDGLARMDLSTEKFHTLLTDNITAIHFHESLYVGRANEILRLDPATDRFETVCLLPDSVSEITAISIDRSHRFWIGTKNCGIFTRSADGGLSHPTTEGQITNIYEDAASNIWIGSWDQGLFRFDAKGGMENFRHDAANPNSLPSDFVRSCCEDNMGNLWIGTFLGLCKYTPSEHSFTTYNSPLTHLSIWCTIKDRQGTLWIGTYFGGVNWFNPEYAIYTRYGVSSAPARGLSFGVVGKMTEDRRGRLWICTEGGGVDVYDREKDSYRWYRHDERRNSISHNNVKAICYDPAHEVMWFGTHLGGLSRLDMRTDRFTTYSADPRRPDPLPSDIVRDILLYRGNLLLATSNGVALLDPQTNRVQRLFRDTETGRRISTVSDMAFDRDSVLWLAVSGEGVFSYEFAANRLVNYRHQPSLPSSLSSNNVVSIVPDSQGQLWFAHAGTGIDLFRADRSDFENFDSHNAGLGGDCIYEICDNGDGTLCVTTNNGFSVLDPRRHTSDNYSRHNGFPLSSPNENAMYIARDSTIFVGGADGLISFRRDRLNFKRKPYEIIFNRLFVNRREVTAGDATRILRHTLSDSREIRLASRYTSFSIEFATSNYIPENHDEIEFMLEGFTSDWMRAAGNTITYTNLNAGNFRLLLRRVGDEDRTHQAELDIVILPPFYKTVWAYLLYTILTLGLAFVALRTYYGRVRLHEMVKYEQNRIRDIEALNQSKLRFFTNISHEFRTPLTIIVGQIENLLRLQSLPASVYRHVSSIHRSSMQLNELIGELLDFRKQEQGHMKIRARKADFTAFVDEDCHLFAEYTRTRGVELHVVKPADPIFLWFDAKQMRKVLNNLLSNAVKHTPRGGSITVTLRQEEKWAVLSVKDTGEGIDADDLSRIFDRFYQSDKSEVATTQGTGIGLALTKGIVELHGGEITARSLLGEGAEFTLHLPLDASHLTPEQIAAADSEDTGWAIAPDAPNADGKLPLLDDEAIDEVCDRVRGAKILIVEDNDALRSMLVDIFAPLYRVVTAADGEQGWCKVQEEKPQIVLSDVLMPRMSGIELCKRIKGDINTCHIPVVLLTARTAVEYNIEGLRIGADDYIVKPFNTEILVARCNNLVNGRLLLQERFSSQPERQTYQLATNQLDQQLLDRAVAIVEKYMDDLDFNVNVFVTELGMSRTNMFNKIKAITGLTPNDFVLTVRLKHAAQQLCNNPELNISQISDASGFNSPRYFSKCFRDHFGVSPLAYRNGRTAKPDRFVAAEQDGKQDAE